MATVSKFDSFVEALMEKKHDLGADTLKLLLTNTAPLATNSVKADLTEITPGNGYAAGGPPVPITSSSQTGGVYKLIGNDVVITAAAGPIGPFRYVVLYNDTAASKELIGWWDYASPITLADTETFTVDFSAVDGILSLS